MHDSVAAPEKTLKKFFAQCRCDSIGSVTTIFHYFFFCVIITILYYIFAILLTGCSSLYSALILLVLPPIINDLRVVDVIDVIFL